MSPSRFQVGYFYETIWDSSLVEDVLTETNFSFTRIWFLICFVFSLGYAALSSWMIMMNAGDGIYIFTHNALCAKKGFSRHLSPLLFWPSRATRWMDEKKTLFQKLMSKAQKNTQTSNLALSVTQKLPFQTVQKFSKSFTDNYQISLINHLLLLHSHLSSTAFKILLLEDLKV